MADAPGAKPAPKPPAPPKSSGGGGFDDQGFEAVLFVMIIVFVVFSTSGAILSSFFNVAKIPFIDNTIIILKIISGTVGTVCFAVVLYLASKLIELRKQLEPHDELFGDLETPEAAFNSRAHAYAYEWHSIKNRLETASDSDAPMIILEADALMDRILQERNVSGETTGDRLKTLGEQKFQSVNDAWDAHKVRNQIAHEGGRGITYSDAVYALEKYERVFKELEAI